MKLRDIISEDNFGMTPQQRMMGNIGRILMAQAEQVKDDALANTMAKVGNEMTNMGALFGPNSLKDLEKKTDVPVAVIQKLIQYGKKVHDATKDIKADHKDGGLNDNIEEKSKGLYYYVNKNKKSGKKPRPKGHPDAPSDQDWKDAAKTAKEDLEEGNKYRQGQINTKPSKDKYTRKLKPYKPQNKRGCAVGYVLDRARGLCIPKDQAHTIRKPNFGETTSAGGVAAVATNRCVARSLPHFTRICCIPPQIQDTYYCTMMA